MPSLRLPDIGSQLEPGNPTPGAHTTGALGHASMLAAPASGRVAVLAPRRQARRVVARRVAVARALDGAGDRIARRIPRRRPPRRRRSARRRALPCEAGMAHRARNGGLMRRALRRGADASGARRRRRRRGGERVCLVSRRARGSRRVAPRGAPRAKPRRGRVPHRGRQFPPRRRRHPAHGLVRRELDRGQRRRHPEAVRRDSTPFSPTGSRTAPSPSSRVFSTG